MAMLRDCDVKGWNASAASVDLAILPAQSTPLLEGVKSAQDVDYFVSEMSTPLASNALGTGANQVRDNSLKALANKAELVTIPPDG